jgi:hypothetical protein
MKRLIFVITIASLIYSCEKSNNTKAPGFTARIDGFDLNCSTCILSFPFDSNAVKKELGSSPENLYKAVNLNKNDMKLGQMVKVEVRKAEPEELSPCLTLYPSLMYENVFVTSVDDFDSFSTDDTILLPLKDCGLNIENQAYICFESVSDDSRCPDGAQCVWAGDAKAKFKYVRLNEDPVFFSLNTNVSFTNDSIIDGYKFTLLNLYPYPSLKHHTDQNKYKAELVIQKVTN